MTILCRTLTLLFLALVLWASEGSCSGVTVSNVSLGTRNSGTGNAPVNFDISWNNSWRLTDPGASAPNNWDAAWVFVKFRKNNGNWSHATLSNGGHTVPSGAWLDVGLADTSSSYNISTNPVVGVFIYRSADGNGTFTKTGFSLNWKFAQDGVGTGDTVDVKVFAIEMVYVPDGSFFAGDNATSTASFKQGSMDNDPWYIGSEGAITTANAAGSGTGVAETANEYYYVTDPNSNDDASGAVFTIPAAFPKGYGKFYMMKGEVSQGQWQGFFNTLTATQKSSRDITGASGKNRDSLWFRNNVSWTSGEMTLPDQGAGAIYEWVAMNYISWADLAAYLDWAGLRPMSELEFERGGRGPYRAVSGEYAWGSTSLTQANSISSGGTSAEAPGSAANCVYGNHANIQGPMRVGAMAYGDATRIDSGAAYYGALDLSGNVSEMCVTVGSSTGRTFEGRYHGNGSLTSDGDGNSTSWPATDSVGIGLRGGGFSDSSTSARVSSRDYGAYTSTARTSNAGGRGARTAPIPPTACSNSVDASRPNDCYNEGSSPNYAQDLAIGTLRQGPGGAVLTLQYANGSSGFKIWTEDGGSRVLNATGIVANGWQQTLTRAGTAFSGSNFTTPSVIGGRACPPNVFLNFSNMVATGRCLYYDGGNGWQALNAASGTEAEDWILSSTSAASGRGSGLSYYEGNIKTCADKGMRLLTMYESTHTMPAWARPSGDTGVSPTWADATTGVPSASNYTWTASSGADSYYWQYNTGGGDYGSYGGGAGAGRVRCVLP